MKINIELVIKLFFYEIGVKKIVLVCLMECVGWFKFYVSFYSYNFGDKDCKIKVI